MNILITGAGGFLGKHLAKSLLDLNYKVWNFSRNSHSELLEMGVQTIQGDLKDASSVKNALLNMDAVFHLASMVGMWGKYDDFYAVNVQGTKNIIDACRFHGIKKLVYTSSPSVVFGIEDLCGVDESIAYPEKYLCHYASTKAMAEELLLRSNDHELATVALRPHLIFGPNDPHIFPKLIEKAKLGKLKIVGSGKNLVDVLYVQNAVDAHIQVFGKLEIGSNVSGQTYFLGQEKPVVLWDFINEILVRHNLTKLNKSISGKSAYFLGWLFEKIYRAFRIKTQPPMTRFISLQFSKSHFFDHSKAKKDFGYYPRVSVADALNRSIRSLDADR